MFSTWRIMFCSLCRGFSRKPDMPLAATSAASVQAPIMNSEVVLILFTFLSSER
ncbi:hypothetical protein D3C75_1279860 [compost metagenome]